MLANVMEANPSNKAFIEPKTVIGSQTLLKAFVKVPTKGNLSEEVN